jgi:hypothetical protein
MEINNEDALAARKVIQFWAHACMESCSLRQNAEESTLGKEFSVVKDGKWCGKSLTNGEELLSWLALPCQENSQAT